MHPHHPMPSGFQVIARHWPRGPFWWLLALVALFVLMYAAVLFWQHSREIALERRREEVREGD